VKGGERGEEKEPQRDSGEGVTGEGRANLEGVLRGENGATRGQGRSERVKVEEGRRGREAE